MPRTREWLSAPEAAAELGFSRDTINRLLQAGRLPGYQATPGGHWRIKRQVIEDLKRVAERRDTLAAS